jgi:hypothetical protein
VEPTIAVMFMSGVILSIVGAGRAIAVRARRGVLADEAGTSTVPVWARPDVAVLLWSALSLYGLFLAAAGVAFGR